MAKKRILSISLFGAALALIAFLSLQPFAQTDSATRRIIDIILSINNAINRREVAWGGMYVVVRKLAHVVEYFILGLAAAYLFTGSRHRILYPSVLSAAVSVADQCTKIAIPRREFDLTDMPFDFLGYMLGILLVAVFENERKLKKKQTNIRD